MKLYKILSILIIFILFFQPIWIASDTLYVWADDVSQTTEVNSEVEDDFLNIESESVILIEQKSRSNFIWKRLSQTIKTSKCY